MSSNPNPNPSRRSGNRPFGLRDILASADNLLGPEFVTKREQAQDVAMERAAEVFLAKRRRDRERARTNTSRDTRDETTRPNPAETGDLFGALGDLSRIADTITAGAGAALDDLFGRSRDDKSSSDSAKSPTSSWAETTDDVPARGTTKTKPAPATQAKPAAAAETQAKPAPATETRGNDDHIHADFLRASDLGRTYSVRNGRSLTHGTLIGFTATSDAINLTFAADTHGPEETIKVAPDATLTPSTTV